jgi:pyruvate kinase
MRRTKIVATMGPATDTPEAVEALVAAGVNVVRMNFSHGSPEEHMKRAEMVRAAAKKLDTVVGILGDLQGPKIRIDRFADGKISLARGDAFILDAALDRDAGNQERVGIAYKTLPNEVSPGDELWLDDGRIVLTVEKIEGQEVHTRVLNGGFLSNNKGINRRGGGLSADALTEKDKEDIKTAAKIDVDYLAVSFPRNAEDIEYARKLMQDAGGDAGIVAKIERAEAIEHPVLDEIIQASDVIMIARGDLGVEIGDAKLPMAQKMMISKARSMDKIVITATQMMETMIENPIPTRAEVFDVANAVMDGTDAVMLSGETATGDHPDLVVETMAKICEEAEHSGNSIHSDHRIGQCFKLTDQAIAMASMYVANQSEIKSIAALTESGSTALWMSRISSGKAIYALTTHEKTCRRVCLYRGVYPELLTQCLTDPKTANRVAVDQMVEDGVVSEGDLVLVTKGDLMGKQGGTNQMKILRVGDHADG